MLNYSSELRFNGCCDRTFVGARMFQNRSFGNHCPGTTHRSKPSALRHRSPRRRRHFCEGVISRDIRSSNLVFIHQKMPFTESHEAHMIRPPEKTAFFSGKTGCVNIPFRDPVTFRCQLFPFRFPN